MDKDSLNSIREIIKEEIKSALDQRDDSEKKKKFDQLKTNLEHHFHSLLENNSLSFAISADILSEFEEKKVSSVSIWPVSHNSKPSTQRVSFTLPIKIDENFDSKNVDTIVGLDTFNKLNTFQETSEKFNYLNLLSEKEFSDDRPKIKFSVGSKKMSNSELLNYLEKTVPDLLSSEDIEVIKRGFDNNKDSNVNEI